MRGLYVVAAFTMAGVSSVFVLLAELEQRYDLSTSSLGWIAGSAFAAALVTQLGLARYADRGYGLLLLRGGVAAAAIGLLWFAAGDGALAVRRRAVAPRRRRRDDHPGRPPGDRRGVDRQPR